MRKARAVSPLLSPLSYLRRQVSHSAHLSCAPAFFSRPAPTRSIAVRLTSAGNLLSYRRTRLRRWPRAAWLFVPLLLALLTISHAAESVTLAWDAEPDAAGYRLHYGTISGIYSKTIDVGNNAEATLSDLTSGVTCFCTVTAYNSAGLESPPSEEYSFFVATRSRTVRPTAPQGTDAPSTPVSRARPQRPPPPLERTTANQPTPTLPVISGPRRLQDGSFQFMVTSTPGAIQGISVYVSGNLKNWTLLTNAFSPTGTLLVTDPAAASVNRRFYRVSSP